MSLALKHRPQTLGEVEGNDSTVKALTALLQRDKEDINHSMLFTGPSGCGKTTLARIVSNELGCIGNDFHEIDSADFRGIDTIREIRQKMWLAPTEGACVVYLLDECHQCSKDAQSALLKALEDSPPHVYFLLATTDPEKLLPTIRGRCVNFPVSPLSEDQMSAFLTLICRTERRRVSKEVIEQIACDSLGSCRNALQILDKIIDLDAEEMEEAARQISQQENQVIELCRALFAGKAWKEIATILRGLEKEDIEKTRLSVMGYCSSILLSEKTKDAPQAFIVMDEFKNPFYNNGRAGLVYASYAAVEGCK